MFSYYGYDDDSQNRILDLTNMDTSSLKYADDMFNKCTSLQTIFVSDKFVTTNIATSKYMFENCLSIYGGKGTIYDSSYVDANYAHFDEGYISENPGYFTSLTDQLLYWGLSDDKTKLYLSSEYSDTTSNMGLRALYASKNSYVE